MPETMTLETSRFCKKTLKEKFSDSRIKTQELLETTKFLEERVISKWARLMKLERNTNIKPIEISISALRLETTTSR
jgi:hypothetical protein